MKRLLRLLALAFVISLVFAFSWPWPASASNLSKEERTSVLLDIPYLSLLQLQEEKKGEKLPEAKNPNKDGDKQQGKPPPPPPKAENPNKDGGKQQGSPGGPSQPGNGFASVLLVIVLIIVVGAAGLWFALRRRSS